MKENGRRVRSGSDSKRAKEARGGARLFCMAAKYLFALAFPVLAVVMHRVSPWYLAAAAVELLAIAAVSELLYGVRSWLGYAVNSLLLLVVNIQFAVLFWANTFVSTVMLTNLDSIEDLGGKAVAYGLTAVAVAVFSLLPVKSLGLGRRRAGALSLAAVAAWAVLALAGMGTYSPFHGVYTLGEEYIARRRLLAEIGDLEGTTAAEFFRDGVSDAVHRPASLADKPNVILIFVEGLSQNIIEDPREITPNLRALEDKTLRFENYYNHTFATYMGLSGQLYSGYQHQNYDVNNLVSLQSIFSDRGYSTAFINVEPNNPEFSEYLADFNFHELVTDLERIDGHARSNSDKSAYGMLFETAQRKKEEGKPFFLSLYSLGTHASFDGVYETYGDGSDPFLNKFRDMDTQVGEFLNRFFQSDLAQDTVVILTADHAAYQDADFTNAFPDYVRAAPTMDRIPLMIWYPGVEGRSLDAGGRNSLDLAPTVLDLLDFSAPNYFLGDSLFAAESDSRCDRFFESNGTYISTVGGSVANLTPGQWEEFRGLLTKYFAAKLGEEVDPGLAGEEPESYIYAKVNDRFTAIETELTGAGQWDTLQYAVWSTEGGQDDLVWITVPGNREDTLYYDIDLSRFWSRGRYNIHVYAGEGEDRTLLAETWVNVMPPEGSDFGKDGPPLTARMGADGASIDTELAHARQWGTLRYAVWSEENGQDDLNWFVVPGPHEDRLECKISLAGYVSEGTYYVHVYAETDEGLTFLHGTQLSVEFP